MNSLWDIRIFLGLVPKESPCIMKLYKQLTKKKQNRKLINWHTINRPNFKKLSLWYLEHKWRVLSPIDLH
jgi:hypothetical protein